MLTHRNKKPYECKAEGCGKSYCDARSLRRHTENHHNSSSSTSTTNTTTTVSATTMSPAQGAASGDAASPHGSNCIQYAPPSSSTTSTSKSGSSTTSSGKSQLQQLLSTEPTQVSNMIMCHSYSQLNHFLRLLNQEICLLPIFFSCIIKA